MFGAVLRRYIRRLEVLDQRAEGLTAAVPAPDASPTMQPSTPGEVTTFFRRR